jgi:hypothetical protein
MMQCLRLCYGGCASDITDAHTFEGLLHNVVHVKKASSETASLCAPDKIQRPPSWLHKTWIQDLLQKVTDRVEEEDGHQQADKTYLGLNGTRGSSILHFIHTVAQLRHVPSTHEAECLKVLTFHVSCLRTLFVRHVLISNKSLHIISVQSVPLPR